MRKQYDEPNMQVIVFELEVITLVSGGDFTPPDPDGGEVDRGDIF